MSLNNFTNNVRRQEILERLGIEQLPPLMPGEEYAHAEPERGGSVPMVMLPVSGFDFATDGAAVSDPFSTGSR